MTIMTNKGTFTKAAVLSAMLTYVRENGVDTTYHGINDEGVEFDVPAHDIDTTLSTMIAQLEKARPTKTNPANDEDSNTILAYLRENRGTLVTATEILVATAKDFVGSASNQRVSNLLKKLAENGMVERMPDKRKVYWQATDTE